MIDGHCLDIIVYGLILIERLNSQWSRSVWGSFENYAMQFFELFLILVKSFIEWHRNKQSRTSQASRNF